MNMNNNFDHKGSVVESSIFTIGSVSSVKGKDITVKVNKDKNLPHLFFKGRTIKNVSVGLSNYVKILKGFTEIICKVEGEYVEEDKFYKDKKYVSEKQRIERFLNVSVFGFYDDDRKFQHGIKEMPLIGSECKLLSRSEFEDLHKLSDDKELSINLGSLIDEEAQEINISVQKLFAGHIGIFGNTGSGKSNTLTRIYSELFGNNNLSKNFGSNSKFVFVDFNGEYSNSGDGNDLILSEKKKVYKLSTEIELKDIAKENKIPLGEKNFLDIELLSILSNATEKTQKPFLNRVINLYRKITKEGDDSHFKNSLKFVCLRILKLKNKDLAYLCLDRYKQILKIEAGDTTLKEPEWHNTYSYFKCGGDASYESISDENYKSQDLYKRAENYSYPNNIIEKFIDFCRLRLLYDLLDNRVQNEHVYPCITKLESIKKSIQKVFDTDINSSKSDIFDGKNLVIIDLKHANRDIKKSLPLVVLKSLYEEQKSNYKQNSSLHIIIDEAHNILSENSVRESESWKDYRLETFEEIVKEGRKFGVFLAISSQRPSDISPTIISQLHNYFIHKLMNENDLRAINKAVSYLDKLSFDSISNLATGCCFIAGQLTQFPLSVKVKRLEKSKMPKSETIDLNSLWKA